MVRREARPRRRAASRGAKRFEPREATRYKCFYDLGTAAPSDLPRRTVLGGHPETDVYDVAIIGGALSGAATAILLLQKNPALRVLIVERSAAFERRVGESTIEISTYFLIHQLGLAEHLNEQHYVKQGLRFYFSPTSEAEKFDDCTELGGRFLTRVPAFMVDRAVLDEEVLRRACALGAELRRPAQMVRTDLAAGGASSVSPCAMPTAARAWSARVGWSMRRECARCSPGRKAGIARTRTIPRRPCGRAGQGVKNLDGPETARQIPRMVRQGLRHAPHGDQPRDGRRLVGVVHPAEGRGCQRRARLRPALRDAAAGSEHGRDGCALS